MASQGSGLISELCALSHHQFHEREAVDEKFWNESDDRCLRSPQFNSSASADRRRHGLEAESARVEAKFARSMVGENNPSSGLACVLPFPTSCYTSSLKKTYSAFHFHQFT